MPQTAAKITTASKRLATLCTEWCLSCRALTVKLRGRIGAPRSAEGAQSLSARGANPEAPHGPLQRLLDNLTCCANYPIPVILTDDTVEACPRARPSLFLSGAGCV